MKHMTVRRFETTTFQSHPGYTLLPKPQTLNPKQHPRPFTAATSSIKPWKSVITDKSTFTDASVVGVGHTKVEGLGFRVEKRLGISRIRMMISWVKSLGTLFRNTHIQPSASTLNPKPSSFHGGSHYPVHPCNSYHPYTIPEKRAFPRLLSLPASQDPEPQTLNPKPQARNQKP